METKKFKGRGYFPLDMLRYDCCWPTDTEAVNSISHVNFREDRIVSVTSNSKFTIARWATFGWVWVPDKRAKRKGDVNGQDHD